MLSLKNSKTCGSGADSVSTVRWVTVQSGGSVTIPCLYEDTYKNHVKYWCRGIDDRSCPPIVRTDSPQTKGDVSIRDDPDQRVFTVTMNHLTTEDADFYCCRVEISGHSDVGEWLTLSVTDGSPELSVDKQEVTGVAGDSVSVQCHYGDSRSQKMWCKMGGSCLSGNSGSLDGRPVEIRDDRVNKVFSVTMRGLERKDTGWYWCDDGHQQIPVQITVIQPSPLVQLALYVVLGLLVLLYIFIFIILTWKVLDKRKKKMTRNQNHAARTMTMTPPPVWKEIALYASVEPGDDVIYSSIVLPGPEMSSSSSAASTSVVIYSSVALKHSE
ncbi:polymeric immunoglobulin receptor-like isoform X2 [Brienomyrus brachyistius]|uniref:polymeric immunoglobulin receptor-like isoform X2 n=1 Tax=Brienomyrus brachyistius TaxID=42636 RepID=UPI0020B191AB|nr:polymeric immunoglobulin receptor-like isoform X2 [Brienomyrus brachyistius]